MDLNISKTNRIDQFIISAQQRMRDGMFKNDYVNLYKYLVGYSLQSLPTDYEDPYWKGINALEVYFKKLQRKKEPCTFINQYCDWTYVEVTFDGERPFYSSLVKLYVPVKYSDLCRIARTLSNQSTFIQGFRLGKLRAGAANKRNTNISNAKSYV